MNANNDPLDGSNLLAVLRRRSEGRPLEFAGRQTDFFSSGRIKIVGSSPRNCPEVAVVRVSKNAKRCKQVTKNRVATGKSAAVTVWRHVEFMNVRFWGKADITRTCVDVRF